MAAVLTSLGIERTFVIHVHVSISQDVYELKGLHDMFYSVLDHLYTCVQHKHCLLAHAADISSKVSMTYSYPSPSPRQEKWCWGPREISELNKVLLYFCQRNERNIL